MNKTGTEICQNGFNPLSLENGWKLVTPQMLENELASFNPLSLENGWKSTGTAYVINQVNMFQSAFAGEWLEDSNFADSQIVQGVSIRFRWRVVGRTSLSSLTRTRGTFQSAFAGEWLEGWSGRYWAEIDGGFNPLSLENGWKCKTHLNHKRGTIYFNPLSLENGWKQIMMPTRPLMPNGFQSAFAGEWLEVWSETAILRRNTVSIRFRWRMVGSQKKSKLMEEYSGFNPLSLENGWKILRKFGTNGSTSFNPLSLENGWKLHDHFLTLIGGMSFNPLSLENGWKPVGLNMTFELVIVSIRFRWRVVGRR